jgi:hypothetical protein
MTVDQQFNTIYEKLQLLLKQHQRLQKEAERLRAELQAAKESDRLLGEKIETLQLQVSILKAGTGEMDEKEKKEFERKINQYIRQIDKCIAYLSQ